MAFYHPTARFSTKGKVLVVPVVSVANVAQLAADLLIASLSLHRVGIFDPRSLVPVVGAREDDLPGVTTPLELFGRDDIDVAVIQQRSPALKVIKPSLTWISDTFFTVLIPHPTSPQSRILLTLCWNLSVPQELRLSSSLAE